MNIDWINFQPFKKVSAPALRQQHLEEYQFHLVMEEAAASYHSKMAEYYRDGISRLQYQQKILP